MTAIGRRILYLRSLDVDREQFWALLRPWLDPVPTQAETHNWYERGELPAWMLEAVEKAREAALRQEQEPTWRQKSRM